MQTTHYSAAIPTAPSTKVFPPAPAPRLSFPMANDILISERVDGVEVDLHVYAKKGLTEAIFRSLPKAKGAIHSWYSPEQEAGNWLFLYVNGKQVSSDEDVEGLADWVETNAHDFEVLTAGTHRAVWWGYGIGRGYGCDEGERHLTFVLPLKWADQTHPACCSVAPTLYSGVFDFVGLSTAREKLRKSGSQLAKGFKDPAGLDFHIGPVTLTVDLLPEPETLANTRKKKNVK